MVFSQQIIVPEDRAVIEDLLDDYKLKWHQLPTFLRDDVEYARSRADFASNNTAQGILHHFPALRSERNFFLNYLNGVEEGDNENLSVLLEKYASPEILNDRTVMELALRKGTTFGDTFDLVSPLLKESREFLASALNEKPLILDKLSSAIMRSFPTSVKHTLPLYADHLENVFFDHRNLLALTIQKFDEKVPLGFWQGRSFVLEWFGAGLPFLKSFPVEWRSDKEIFLLLARECRENHPYVVHNLRMSFASASLLLCGDKNFMLQVVKHDPYLLRFAPLDLQQDFHLALAAFSGKKKRVELYFCKFEYEGRDKFILQFIASIQSMETMSHTFSSTVLPLIASNQSEQKSTLAILNQGPETAKGYLDVLANFLVSTVEQLEMIHRASSILPDAMQRKEEDFFDLDFFADD